MNTANITVDLAPFETSTLPEGHGGELPPEVRAFKPLTAPAAAFEELRDRFAEAQRKTYALVAELGGAVNADRHALAVATAAGDPDPGDEAVAALRERVVSSRRKMQGLADSLAIAYRELIAALEEHREGFEATLDLDQTERRERAAELVAELAATIDAAAGPAAALRWYALTIDPARSWGSLANIHRPPATVSIHGAEYPLANVLQAFVAAS